MTRIALVLLACLFAPGLLAYNELTGKEAPSFDARTCVNPPADGATTLEACRGSVVLIKYWGPN